jgi:hypothetical protein
MPTAVGRDAGAVVVLADGLRGVRIDRCGRAAGLVAAHEPAAVMKSARMTPWLGGSLSSWRTSDFSRFQKRRRVRLRVLPNQLGPYKG